MSIVGLSTQRMDNLAALDYGPEFPSSHGHSVQFYEDDSFLLDSLSRFIGAAIVAGDSAIAIATQNHRDGLCERLRAGGLDVTKAMREGRFLCLDAAETLARFTVEGQLDPFRFQQVIGSTVSQLADAAKNGSHRVAAFGEMVTLLWADGKCEAAIRLEQLWNQLLENHPFQLHCAYPLSLFSQLHDAAGIQSICAEHSHVTPGEKYTALQSEEERLRAVALLQQKAQALERQIRERDKIQIALREREAELSEFLENAIMPMHWVAADGTILWANKAELALLGFDREEYVGHHISEFHADEEVMRDILQRLWRKEELRGYKARLRCKDGSIRMVRTYSDVLWKNGEFVHTRCFSIDVTERERSERRLAAQLAVTRALADSESLAEMASRILQTMCEVSACEMAALWQPDEQNHELHCVTRWVKPELANSEFAKTYDSVLFGKGEGLPGRVWKSNQPAWISDLRLDENVQRNAVATTDGLRSAFAFPVAVKDGVAGVFEFFSSQVLEPDVEFMNMMAGIGIQMGQATHRKQFEDARTKLAAIVESSDDAIVSKDLNGIVTSWNAAAERIFGYSSAEIVGRSITLLIPPELQSDEVLILSKIRAGQRIEHFQTVRLRKDGTRIDVSLTVSPIKDEHGNTIGAAKIARDVTQQKKLESALHTSERLASVGRLAATVAHEINNPLEAITNYIYLAKQQPGLSERLQRYLDSADRELARVSHIAQQTLGFYRDNSQPVPLVIAEVIGDVLTIYQRKFEYKGLTVQQEIESGLSALTLQGELKQMLSNLVSNAIDACNEGGKIIIRARGSEDYRSHRPGIRITVADNGVGIPVQDKPRIFTPFFSTKREVGTGLGLWITQDLLNKKGGHIRFRSSQSVRSGTAMSIFLPTTMSKVESGAAA